MGEQKRGEGESEERGLFARVFFFPLYPDLFFTPAARALAQESKRFSTINQLLYKAKKTRVKQSFKKSEEEKESRRENISLLFSRNVEARREGDVPPHGLRNFLHLPPERGVAHHPGRVAELAGGLKLVFWWVGEV
jgi:hypothetical protein